MDEFRYLIRVCNRHLPMRPVCALFLITFLILLPVICYNLQYSSYFYPGNINYASYLARRRDSVRMAKAETYFADMRKRKLVPYEYARGHPPVPSGPTISLVISAVNRNTHEIDEFEPHYLTQSLHALLKALDWDTRTYGRRWRRVNISVCNVDAYPDRFGEADRLSSFARVFQRQHPFKIGNPVCKEKEDFAFCLSQVALKEENDYIVLMEDDMLARVDAMDALWKLVGSHLPHRFGTADRIQKRLGAVHLHTPMKHYQYSFWDSSTWLELMLISIGGSFTLFFLYFRIHFRPYHNWANMFLLGFLGIYCILVVLLIGRPHILAAQHAITRHYSLNDAPGPNFSAVVFPLDLVSDLTAHVQHVECSKEFTKASAVAQFLDVHKRRNLAYYPSLFQHIGLYSVYRHDTIYPFELDA